MARINIAASNHEVLVHRAAMVLLFVSALVAACAHRAGISQSTAPGEDVLATKVCGFDVDGKRHEVRYRIELVTLRPLTRGSLVEVAFENPLDPDMPLRVEQVMTGSERDLQFLSPPVKGIRERQYGIVVRLYASADRTKLLATHTQPCEAPFNQRELGPEYR